MEHGVVLGIPLICFWIFGMTWEKGAVWVMGWVGVLLAKRISGQRDEYLLRVRSTTPMAETHPVGMALEVLLLCFISGV